MRHTWTSRAREQARARRRSPFWVLEGLEHRVLLTPTTYMVTSTSNDPTVLGSLPWAINQANNQGSPGYAPANSDGSQIAFDLSVFDTPQTIALTSTLELSETDGPEVIEGPGANVMTISGNGAVGVFQVASGVMATLSELTITDGRATQGGGIENAGTLTVARSGFDNNEASDGGGIFNAGTLAVSVSTFSNNMTNRGGGIDNTGILTVASSTFTANSSDYGGGLGNESGTATIDRSTFLDNSAYGGGGLNNSYGATITITNSTIAGNSAYNGGGIADTGTLTAINDTVAYNQIVGNSGSGGGLDAYDGTDTLYDTIVALNTDGPAGGPADDIALYTYEGTIGGTISPSSAYNLIGTGGSGGLTNGQDGNQVGISDPGLGPLADNGGPTQTIALLAGSPAIDAVRASIPGVTVPATDQRGALRGPAGLDAGTTVDIGAYEASSSYLVTSTADSTDAGTLRTAIGWANVSANANPANLSDPAPNTIDFGIPTTDPGYDATTASWTIAPLSALPPLAASITIDGTSQPGYTPGSHPVIVLSGANAADTPIDGLDLTGSGSTVKGLVINGFLGDGLNIESNQNTIQGNFIGTDVTGTQPGYNFTGIAITGTSNLVGTSGQDGANDPSERNVIAGNAYGIVIDGSGGAASGNVVTGNWIGLNVDSQGNSLAGLGNSEDGIVIESGATGNWIGTNPVFGPANTDQRNVISGSGLTSADYGVLIEGTGTSGNVVAGDDIGTTADGTAALGNGTGVGIDRASDNWIGVNAAAGPGTENAVQADVISGNVWAITIDGVGASGNVLAGDFIGTDPSGSSAVPNTLGLEIAEGASANVIGTSGQDGPAVDALERNVIAGNLEFGVSLDGTTGNVVAGNDVGTTAAGNAPLGNGGDGIEIVAGASGNWIGVNPVYGSRDADQRNLIAGNVGAAVEMTGAGTIGNVVAGNLIGTDSTGSVPIPDAYGVMIDQGASSNLVGTSGQDGPAVDALERNVIAASLFTCPGCLESGVLIENAGSDDNVVAGNWIGFNVDSSGAIITGLGNGDDGVEILAGASNNWIGVNPVHGAETADQRNVISGNRYNGVAIGDFGGVSSGNVVAGNEIGTDPSGMTSVLNGQFGIYLAGSDNLIGTSGQDGADDALEGNVISGNSGAAIYFTNAGTSTTPATGNVIAGDWIGTTADGTAALPNGSGIDLYNSPGNWIGVNPVYGQEDSDQRDVISGNTGNGVQISGSGATGNVIAGDLIGTDATGETLLRNAGDGIHINGGPSDNWIGVNAVDGPESVDQGNVISGNAFSGVYVDPSSTGNVIAGDRIGTDSAGETAIPNNWGVYIQGPSNLVGTTGQDGADDALERNIISGNKSIGIDINGTAAMGNVIAGNDIGTDMTGEAALNNGSDDVNINGGASDNWIGVNAIDGPETADQGNVISGTFIGVALYYPGTSGNVVAGNRIGTDPAGAAAVPNNYGVVIALGASSNRVGTSGQDGAADALERNQISGYTVAGLLIYGQGYATTGNVVAGNLIGTTVSGDAPLGSGNVGVDLILGASGNWIGVNPVDGPENADQRNVISGNAGDGVEISGSGTTGNLVVGNFIGTSAAGTAVIANGGDGVAIDSGAAANTIGGSIAAARNVISGNAYAGVGLSAANDNVIEGNFIGTDTTGTVGLGNNTGSGLYSPQYGGIAIVNGSSGNTIGGLTASPGTGAGNLISGNDNAGVQIYGSYQADPMNNLIAGNLVGTDITGTLALGNCCEGVGVENASNNIVGTPGGRNVISGSNINVEINGSGATGNLVQNNFIGTDITGTSAIGGTGDGLLLLAGASNNTIGGTTAGDRNVISGSSAYGLGIGSSLSSGNLVEGNFIGSDVTGTVAVANKTGIGISSSPGNTIGGTAAGAGNLVAGSLGNGVYIFGSGATGDLVAGNLIGVNFDSGGNPIPGLGNGGAGVVVSSGASGNTIGWTTTGAGNVIADNAGNGVTVGVSATDTSTDNAILSNAIYGNTGLGIDLGNDGVTLNDSDGHSGPNLFQDFPVLSSAITSNGTTTIAGSLSGTPGVTDRVEFFSNPAASPSDYGQGQTFLGFVDVPINPGGTGSFSTTFSGPVAVGQSITATATDPAGDTSEFSADLILQGATTTVLSSSANPSVFGQPVTLTATVSPTTIGQSTPTGTVTFLDGTTPLGTGTLDDTGTASFTSSTLAVGSHSITAVYGGDPNFIGSTSTAIVQSVTQDGSTAVMTSSANPSILNQSISFTVTVSAAAPGSGTPTGTVQFSIDGTKFGSAVTLVDGTATSGSISTLKLGNHTITASYSGDGSFTASTAPSLTQVVNKDNTTTNLAVAVNPSVYGQSISFTASVSAVAPSIGTPTGSVSFNDGSTTLGTVTLTAGTATFTTAKLPTGQDPITAVYNGNSTFATSASAVLNQTVNQDSTSAVATSSANPSVFGQAVTVTATVSAAGPGSGTPTGTVTFLDGSTTLGTATLNGSGHATFTTKDFAVGTHAITAVYGGDGNFTASTSAILNQALNQDGTNTVIKSSVNPSVYGQSVTFTATVSALSPGSGTPTGTVTFMDGSNTLGTATLGNGKATFKTTALAVGSHQVTAVYGDDGNFTASTSTALIQTVQQDPTTTSVASSKNPSVYGQAVTFTATVKAAAQGSGTPTGTVTFLDGSSTLGSGTLVGGVASFSTTSLSVGSNATTAVYGGDGNFSSSTSTAINQAVNQAGSSTTLVSSNNPSVTGQSVTFTATVSAVAPGSGTPTGTVTFSDGSTALATGTLSSGTASFTTSSLVVGTHSIKVVYGGDANFKTSTSATLKQVVQSSIDGSATRSPANLVPQALGVLPDDAASTGTLTHDLALDQVSAQGRKLHRGAGGWFEPES
ncbi:MAG: beta strand repeat-containing protein [Isosphaeraceae bacterium]